jgi:phage shock protein PspC (stress-responsive transcriptional regulator)
MNRHLYRCRENRVLAGVAGGVAEFFDLDPTLVRVLWFISILFGGIGLVVYIGMAIIVPLEPLAADGAADGTTGVDPAETAGGELVSPEGHRHPSPEGHRHPSRGDGRGTMFVGLVLILFGALALVDAVLPSWADAGRYLVPTFIVGIGVLLVANAIRREPMGS